MNAKISDFRFEISEFRQAPRRPVLCRLGLHDWRLAMALPWIERQCVRCRKRQWLNLAAMSAGRAVGPVGQPEERCWRE